MSHAPSSVEVAYMKAHIGDNLQPNMITSTTICMTSALLATVLRFISRSIGKVKFGKDDFFIIMALVLQHPTGHKQSFTETYQILSSTFSLIMVSRKSLARRS